MLTLICGIPNAGKTTYSEKYDNVIHLDDFHRGHHGHQQFEECNRNASLVEGDVCVEGVYNSARGRRELLKACSRHDKKICIWLDTDVDTCIERERNYRKRQVDIATSHHRSFEKPTLDEGWDEIIIIGKETAIFTKRERQSK